MYDPARYMFPPESAARARGEKAPGVAGRPVPKCCAWVTSPVPLPRRAR